MDFEELKQRAEELASEAVQEVVLRAPEEAGIDRRACCRLYRGPDFLAIDKQDKAAMQYYGGFEYVDASCILEIGDMVFYSTEDNRVQGHHERLAPEEEDELCTACNGSGEGQYDGTRCSYCHGRGTLNKGEGDD